MKLIIASTAIILAYVLEFVGGAASPTLYDTYNCLDASWVSTVAAKYKVTAVQADGRKVHPALRLGLSKPRYFIDDSRLKSSKLYSKCNPSATYYGKYATIDSTTKSIINSGDGNGSLVIEVNTWDTHETFSWIATILLEQVAGFEVTHYLSSGAKTSTARMSSAPEGLCSPVHVNMELWPAGKEIQITLYSNESFNIGSSGYTGRSGWYTTTNFSTQAEKTSNSSIYNFTKKVYADFWKDYKYSDELIQSIPVNDVLNSTYLPKTNVCSATDGCVNNCAKAKACSDYEQMNKTCMVVVLMDPAYDPGYLQSAIANNKIPAYFCYLGYGGAEAYIDNAVLQGKAVTFYHWQPDGYHQIHNNQFVRISLPDPIPDIVNSANGEFGEQGYGKDTSNPVSVDFPVQMIAKYASKLIQNYPTLLSILTAISLQQVEVVHLLENITALDKANKSAPNQYIAACNWIKANYEIWKSWIPPLPLCTSQHFQYTIDGCYGLLRTVTFAWKMPDPANNSLPYECDGGTALPLPLTTSRTCKWLAENSNTWIYWAISQPLCDQSFVALNVTGCGSDYRTMHFSWQYPDPMNSSRSSECQGGLELPEPMLTYRTCKDVMEDPALWISTAASGTLPPCTPQNYLYSVTECDDSAKRSVLWSWEYPHPLDNSVPAECSGGQSLPSTEILPCDYAIYSSGAFRATLVLNLVSLCFIALVTIYTVANRDHPVIKRSQWEMLLIMCLGAIVTVISVILYAGKPTVGLCVARPFVISGGFVMIFGSLLLKSYRVYRVFENKALKKQTFPTSLMLKYFAVFIVVDVIINSIWSINASPKPIIKPINVSGIGPVNQHVCSTTSNPVYQAASFFWKGALLVAGCYFSFKIRNVMGDYQETSWMFLSVSVVSFGCLVLLPLEYAVDLTPTTSYVFLNAGVTLAALLVICLMMIPKYLKMRSALLLPTVPSLPTKPSVVGSAPDVKSQEATEEDLTRIIEENNELKKILIEKDKKLTEKERLLARYESANQ